MAGPAASGAAWLERARAVEAAGYDLLLLPDTRFTPSPFPALAAAAAVTTRLLVAPWVLAAPLRSPAVVVREAAALQLLSGGRFELAIGTGRPGRGERGRGPRHAVGVGGGPAPDPHRHGRGRARRGDPASARDHRRAAGRSG